MSGKGVDLSYPILADGEGPESHLCFLGGSPLDFALKIASDRAVGVLWSAFRRSPFFFEQDFSEAIRGYFGMNHVFLDAVKCFASCRLPIWERFVSELSHDEITNLQKITTSPLIHEDPGTVFLYLFVLALYLNKANHML